MKELEKEKYTKYLTEKAGMILKLLNDDGLVVVNVIEVDGEYVGIIRYKKSMNDDMMALFSDFYGIEREDDRILGYKKCVGFRKAPFMPIEAFLLLTKNKIVGVERGLAIENFYNYLIKNKHPYLLN